MRTFQTKFLAALETVADDLGLELVQRSTYVNVGTLYAQPTEGFRTVATVSFDFQEKTKITFNGSNERRDSFYFAADETDKIDACLSRFGTLLDQAYMDAKVATNGWTA